MYAIRLHQFRVKRYAVHKKRDQGGVILVSQSRINGRKSIGIRCTIIRRYLDARKDNAGAPSLAFFDHPGEVFPDQINRSSSQAIIAAQLDQDYIGMMLFQGAR